MHVIVTSGKSYAQLTRIIIKILVGLNNVASEVVNVLGGLQWWSWLWMRKAFHVENMPECPIILNH